MATVWPYPLLVSSWYASARSAGPRPPGVAGVAVASGGTRRGNLPLREAAGLPGCGRAAQLHDGRCGGGRLVAVAGVAVAGVVAAVVAAVAGIGTAMAQANRPATSRLLSAARLGRPARDGRIVTLHVFNRRPPCRQKLN